MGGRGKTRLGLWVAQELRAAYPDGVAVADLAVLRDDALLEHHAAQALRIRDQTGRELSELLLEYLRDRTLLLVLDNCEHLVDACARFVDRALRAAGGLRVLCTSRQPLGIVGVHIFTVPPLPVPDIQAPAASPPGRYAALLLFVERAAAVVPGVRHDRGESGRDRAHLPAPGRAAVGHRVGGRARGHIPGRSDRGAVAGPVRPTVGRRRGGPPRHAGGDVRLERLRAVGGGPELDEAVLRARHRDYYLELADTAKSRRSTTTT
jgi:hypothetical protein